MPDFRHSAPASAVTFGPALVDDADDAERHAHATDAQPVRARPFGDDSADRIRRAARSLPARAPSPRRGFVQLEPIEQRRAQAAPDCASRMSSALAARMRRQSARSAAAAAISARFLMATRPVRARSAAQHRGPADALHEFVHVRLSARRVAKRWGSAAHDFTSMARRGNRWGIHWPRHRAIMLQNDQIVTMDQFLASAKPQQRVDFANSCAP